MPFSRLEARQAKVYGLLRYVNSSSVYGKCGSLKKNNKISYFLFDFRLPKTYLINRPIPTPIKT